MSPGAMTALVRRATSLFERAEHRTPDVTPPPRPRSAPPTAGSSGRQQRGYEPQRMPRPQWVYRADARPTTEIFRDGFSARPPAAGRPYDYDLVRHQRGGPAEERTPTGFVSTGADPRRLEQWGQNVGANGRPIMADADGRTWQLRTNTIYQIRNSDHFVDALAQDPARRYGVMDGQQEFAAPHRIAPHDVAGATHTTRWENPRPDGTVDVWPASHPQGPDGRPNIHETSQVVNSRYDPGRASYDPDADPSSGWRRHP